MTTTGLFCVAIMIILGTYDAIVVLRTGVGCSISRWMQRTGFHSPVFVLMLGYLLGHFFSPMTAVQEARLPPEQAVAVPTEAKTATTGEKGQDDRPAKNSD